MTQEQFIIIFTIGVIISLIILMPFAVKACAYFAYGKEEVDRVWKK